MYRFPHGGLDPSDTHSNSVTPKLSFLVGYHVGVNYETAICKLIRDATVSEGGKGAPCTHPTARGDLHDHTVRPHQCSV